MCRKFLFIVTIIFVILPVGVACTRRHAADKPLSQVLREKRIAVPHGEKTALPLEAEENATQAETMYQGIPVGIDADHRPYIGSEAPSCVIHVFLDLQCPYCQVAHAKILQWARIYGREVRFVYYHFPLSFHPYALHYARMAVCAVYMGRFWSMIHALFHTGMQKLDERAMARRFGLDENPWVTCLMSREVQAVIDDDIAKGNRLQIYGTPTFVVDEKLMDMNEIQVYLETRFP